MVKMIKPLVKHTNHWEYTTYQKIILGFLISTLQNTCKLIIMAMVITFILANLTTTKIVHQPATNLIEVIWERSMLFWPFHLLLLQWWVGLFLKPRLLLELNLKMCQIWIYQYLEVALRSINYHNLRIRRLKMLYKRNMIFKSKKKQVLMEYQPRIIKLSWWVLRIHIIKLKFLHLQYMIHML